MSSGCVTCDLLIEFVATARKFHYHVITRYDLAKDSKYHLLTQTIPNGGRLEGGGLFAYRRQTDAYLYSFAKWENQYPETPIS